MARAVEGQVGVAMSIGGQVGVVMAVGGQVGVVVVSQVGVAMDMGGGAVSLITVITASTACRTLSTCK